MNSFKEEERRIQDEIFIRVIKKLETIEDWTNSSNNESVCHQTENIQINSHWLHEPDSLRIPRRHRKKIRSLISNIMEFHENIRLTFILEYVSNMYSGYYKLPSNQTDLGKEVRKWLEELNEESYKIVDGVVYFRKYEDHAFLILKWL